MTNKDKWIVRGFMLIAVCILLSALYFAYQKYIDNNYPKFKVGQCVGSFEPANEFEPDRFEYVYKVRIVGKHNYLLDTQYGIIVYSFGLAHFAFQEADCSLFKKGN